MKIIKFLSAMMLAMVAFNAHAVDTRGLTKEQAAEVERQVQEYKNANKPSVVDQVKEANAAAVDMTGKWADVSLAISNGIVDTAAKLGVEANKFASTSLGKLTVVLIVWKVMGKSIIFILLGFVFIASAPFVVPRVWFWVSTADVTYTDKKTWYGREYRVVASRTSRDGEFSLIIPVACAGATLGFLMIAGLNLIMAGV